MTKATETSALKQHPTTTQRKGRSHERPFCYCLIPGRLLSHNQLTGDLVAIGANLYKVDALRLVAQIQLRCKVSAYIIIAPAYHLLTCNSRYYHFHMRYILTSITQHCELT